LAVSVKQVKSEKQNCMFLIFSVPGGSSLCFVLVIGTPERTVEMHWAVGRQCSRSAQLHGLVLHKLRMRTDSFALLHTFQ